MWWLFAATAPRTIDAGQTKIKTHPWDDAQGGHDDQDDGAPGTGVDQAQRAEQEGQYQGQRNGLISYSCSLLRRDACSKTFERRRLGTIVGS